MKTIVIQGSARSSGNTHQIAKILKYDFGAEIIDLGGKKGNLNKTFKGNLYGH